MNWTMTAAALTSSAGLATALHDPKVVKLPKEIQPMHCLVSD
jgi:hypothetical protein